MNRFYLGLGKTLFNSGATLLEKHSNGTLSIELLLSERLTRKKASGVWPEQALEQLHKKYDIKNATIAENRDVIHPAQIELFLNQQFPFFDHLKSKHLDMFSSHFNSSIQWISHHLCHAYAGMLMSPYEKAIVLVMDGAGSSYDDFSADDPHRTQNGPLNRDPKHKYFEESSVYLMDQGNLKCVKKNWQVFSENSRVQGHSFSEGLGSLYEKSAEYIFNDKRAAGKVMGLAAFGQPFNLQKRSFFLEDLDWSKSFRGKSKNDWESSGKFSLYADIAASVQNHFEESVLTLVQELHKKYPDYKNLILMGGCALNCTTNMKIYETNLFQSIYVPPFPGDESIGLGCASFLYHKDPNNTWAGRPWEHQHGYFGSSSHQPDEKNILKTFSDFHIERPISIEAYTAQKISEGAIIAWFQGRSETGPRALGNRSILARVDRKGIKDILNSQIKNRENFRPYGCSVTHESAHEYFEVSKNFESPFMSFAVKTRPRYKNALFEVTHFDGTSRIQTVRSTQNPRLHKLLLEVGKITNLACVLNTSLNVMGEPIVETIEDAHRFFEKTNVQALVIGDFYITKKPS